MTKRKMRDHEEYNAYTGWRRSLFWQQGELAKVKRRTHKRERREVREEIRKESDA